MVKLGFSFGRTIAYQLRWFVLIMDVELLIDMLIYYEYIEHDHCE